MKFNFLFIIAILNYIVLPLICLFIYIVLPLICLFIIILKIKERKKEKPKDNNDLDKFKDY